METDKLVDFDHVTDYISREAAKQRIRDSFSDLAHRCEINAILNSIPAADVVARDCYDRILAENDTMREMLARIGKKCGDSMDDVRPVVRGKWKFEIGDGKTCVDGWVCTNCNCGFHTNVPYFEEFNFCPNCGAEMRNTAALEDAAQDADAGAMAPAT